MVLLVYMLDCRHSSINYQRRIDLCCVESHDPRLSSWHGHSFGVTEERLACENERTAFRAPAIEKEATSLTKQNLLQERPGQGSSRTNSQHVKIQNTEYHIQKSWVRRLCKHTGLWRKTTTCLLNVGFWSNNRLSRLWSLIKHHERLLIPLRKTDAPDASSVPVCIDVVLSDPSSLCILIKQCRSNCKFLQMWEWGFDVSRGRIGPRCGVYSGLAGF